MKLNKRILKEMIYEALNEEPVVPDAQTEEVPVQQTAREKGVERGIGTGGLMDPEEYANLLKQTLLTPKVSTQNRLKALENIFPGQGTKINGWILKLTQQMKQGA